MAKEAPPDAFGNSAREYELGRPRWPRELIERVVRELELAADATVLDLGAGTGKLTRVLAARYRDVTAVEPLANMRAMLQRVVPGVMALAGSAERIPLGRWVRIFRRRPAEHRDHDRARVGAQQVTGTVRDERSGQPMAAVQVFIPGTGVGALTQNNGRYLLLNVPVGPHQVTAQRTRQRFERAARVQRD